MGNAPLFRFVQVNDLHTQAADEHLDQTKLSYERANEKARWLLNAINEEQLFPLPDFVVGVGDLIHGEGLDRLAPDLRAFQDLIRLLRCPFYPAVGNHEVVQREGSPIYEQPYRDAFGDDRVNYTFEHRGLVFVVLNNGGASCVTEEVARARNEWLRTTLEDTPATPKIILAHVPLVLMREPLALVPSFGFRSYVDQDPGTLTLVESHADSIIAVLSGHLHLTGVVRQNGICHICVSGTASYPCDFAHYTVYPDRIEAEIGQLPPWLVTPSTNIHGERRHGRDFIDAAHSTAEEYVCGRPEERRFTIELGSQKQLADPG